MRKIFTQKIKTDPKGIAAEYNSGCNFKASLGDNGLYEQSKINERFFVGDQWYGAHCGNSRPLVRRNLIKRIGEYKMSTINSSDLAVNYSADGIPDTSDLEEQKKLVKEKLIRGQIPSGNTNEAEISVIMSALSEYFNVTAERVRFDSKKEQALRNAYISGTGIVYTYWDSEIETGLYADKGRKVPIKGDIAFEVLDVENVNFGDPNRDDVQSQPFIIIAQRRLVSDVRREAAAGGIEKEQLELIKPDNADYYSLSNTDEPADSRRVTVYTKLYKEYAKNGKNYEVKAVRVTKDAYVRRPWSLGLKNYPIAKINWERRRNCAYGESEITYLIPNQIAINRALTAEVWALMAAGMPITVVNGDVVQTPVSNDPGQIITVYSGLDFQLTNAVAHINPPAFESQYKEAINDLANSTLSDSGADDAALGNFKPDNAEAIIQMREAAMVPMQTYMNRFYDFCEDIARIWADFWLNLYGDRLIKINDGIQKRYIPFDAKRYRNLIINAKIDVGASTVWSESVVVSTLGNLLEKGLITFEQYLERLPGGMIPDVTGLIADLKTADMPKGISDEISDEEILQDLKQKNPELYKKYYRLSYEQQQQLFTLLWENQAEEHNPSQKKPELGGGRL